MILGREIKKNLTAPTAGIFGDAQTVQGDVDAPVPEREIRLNLARGEDLLVRFGGRRQAGKRAGRLRGIEEGSPNFTRFRQYKACLYASTRSAENVLVLIIPSDCRLNVLHGLGQAPVLLRERLAEF